MTVTVDTTDVAGIPVLVAVPYQTAPDGPPVPVVFYVPGYGVTRESGLTLGVRLAQAGLCCVAFDPVHHGARADGRLEAAGDPARAVYPPETGLDVWLFFIETIAHCVEDIRTLRAHLANDARLDIRRCGVTGPSMGGYASFLTFARVPEVDVAVPMIGVPCFARRWRDLLDECRLSNSSWDAALARLPEQIAAHTAFIESVDPAPALAARAGMGALFVMNNDFDSDQPKHYAIETVRTLLPVWAAAGAADRLRLGIYPTGHTVTPEMERDAVAWLARFLL